MRVRFWGTRGSIPKPGRETIRYGGNTSCVELRSQSGTLVVIDCGTGALALGQHLLQSGVRPVRGHLLISHTHWDHIQGLPFFAPLFIPGNEWDVYAPHGMAQSVRETLAGQMQHTYFPVELDQLGANIRYHNLTEGVFTLDDITVRSQYLNHPALALGYRFDVDGVSVAYCCDHEPHSRPLAYGSGEVGVQDRRHIDFIAGADLLIHDAQYRASEYDAKIGWGHSTVEYVLTIARIAEVATVALTHHDPSRNDDTMDAEMAVIRARLAEEGSPLNVFAAAEGESFDVLQEKTARNARPEEAGESAPAEIARTCQLSEQTVLLGVADPGLYGLLRDASSRDGMDVVHAPGAPSALSAAQHRNPSLIILDRDLPGRDALEICRAMRQAAGPDLPIIIAAAREEIGPGIDAGVTDWLIKPFSQHYARTRMRAWLMRTVCRWALPPIPEDELERLAALRDLDILDTEPEERFDKLTRIAAAAFSVPVALVSLVDADRQWFKSACGTELRGGSRETSFCAHAILQRDVMVVPDALLDPRFADSPVVVDEPRVRFYAGCPLVLDNGACVGTLCLVDVKPRQLDDGEIAMLRDLADLVVQQLQSSRRKRAA